MTDDPFELVHTGSRASGRAETSDFWLRLAEGTVVAYLRVIHAPGDELAPLTACDIEVRPGHRERGYARTLIKQVEEHYGLVLTSSGTYTPLGFERLGARMPVYPGGGPPSVQVAAMSFVEDWDSLRQRYPL